MRHGFLISSIYAPADSRVRHRAKGGNHERRADDDIFGEQGCSPVRKQ